MNSYSPPSFIELMNLLLPFSILWEGNQYTVDQWRHKAIDEVNHDRKQGKLTIFNKFASALLEGYRTKGKDYGPRIELMNQHFQDFNDVTENNISEILIKNNYSLKDRGLKVVLDAVMIVKQPSFQWEEYFTKAEAEFRNGYKDDDFLTIKGVGNKVRDFALSEFLVYYCAIDRHVADIMRRTGLVLHGYGQPEFGTSATENYDFLQKLIIQFAEESGWPSNPSNGYSPKEIDTAFWFFGNETGVCKGRLECYRCPLTSICLTFQNWKGEPIKSKQEKINEKRENHRQLMQWAREHPQETEEIRRKYGL